MNYFISDMHLGHTNVIKYDNRPFADAESMDAALIYYWNERVTDGDDVWVLGDFCMADEKNAVSYLRRLRGRKHLVAGNHDTRLLKNSGAMAYFESVDTLTGIWEGKTKVVLCHYPMAEWEGSRKGSLLIYGHLHGRVNEIYDFMTSRYPYQAFNAGCMINGYAPVTLPELKKNNKLFQERARQVSLRN